MSHLAEKTDHHFRHSSSCCVQVLFVVYVKKLCARPIRRTCRHLLCRRKGEYTLIMLGRSILCGCADLHTHRRRVCVGLIYTYMQPCPSSSTYRGLSTAVSRVRFSLSGTFSSIGIPTGASAVFSRERGGKFASACHSREGDRVFAEQKIPREAQARSEHEAACSMRCCLSRSAAAICAQRRGPAVRGRNSRRRWAQFERVQNFIPGGFCGQ